MPSPATPSSPSAPATSAAPATNSWSFSARSIPPTMRIDDPKLIAELAALGIDCRPATSLAELTSLGIGGTTDLLRITKHDSIPALIELLESHHIPYKF